MKEYYLEDKVYTITERYNPSLLEAVREEKRKQKAASLMSEITYHIDREASLLKRNIESTLSTNL